MTVCVAVKVAEGLVMAADSAVTLQGSVRTAQGTQQGVLQTFEFANKVAQIKDYPIGVVSWGAASIADRSIQSLVMEFEYHFPNIGENQDYTVKGIADQFLAFIKQRYDDAYTSKGQHPLLGLFVGGFSSQCFFAEEYAFEFPNSSGWASVRQNRSDGRPSFGVAWYGQALPIVRLIKGYDTEALEQLVARGADLNIVQKWIDDEVAEYPIVFDGMPIQDAIDFADFAVNVVIGMFRFGCGPPLCGGDVDIAVLTPRSFRWARRKKWGAK